jgi:hypothetical protein
MAENPRSVNVNLPRTKTNSLRVRSLRPERRVSGGVVLCLRLAAPRRSLAADVRTSMAPRSASSSFFATVSWWTRLEIHSLPFTVSGGLSRGPLYLLMANSWRRRIPRGSSARVTHPHPDLKAELLGPDLVLSLVCFSRRCRRSRCSRPSSTSISGAPRWSSISRGPRSASAGKT